MSSPFALRRIDRDEVPGCLDALDGVMQRAYGMPSFRQQIEWFAGSDPAAIVVAHEHDRIIGTSCCIAYPEAGFGWIGLVATEPSEERRGVGRAVTQQTIAILAEQGCASVLDASAAGGPLYAGMGFADHGVTRVLSAPPSLHHAGQWGRPSVVAISRDDEASIGDAIGLDTAAFGAARPGVIRTLINQYPGRAALSRAPDGQPTGLVVAQGGAIGPLIAAGDDALWQLVDFALALPWNGPARINVPPESAHLATLLDLGFEPARELRHMRFGIEALPASPATYAGRVSLGVG